MSIVHNQFRHPGNCDEEKQLQVNWTVSWLCLIKIHLGVLNLQSEKGRQYKCFGASVKENKTMRNKRSYVPFIPKAKNIPLNYIKIQNVSQD